MSRRYKFVLKMLATIRLAGKSIDESRKKVKAAFDSVSIEARVGGKETALTAGRDCVADLLDIERTCSGGKLQIIHCFDLMFCAKLEVDAESLDDAHKMVANASLTAIVNIDGKQVRLNAKTDGDPHLLEIDGADPQELISVGGTLMSVKDYAAEFCAWLDELESRDHFDYQIW